MKQTHLCLCLFFVVSLSVNGTRSNTNILPIDTIKENNKSLTVNSQPTTKKIEDYKKATDSILTVATENNFKSEKQLSEIKKYDKLFEDEDKKVKKITKEVNENINKLISQLQQEKQSKNKIKSKKDTAIYITTVDSVFVKSNIFRKARWDYILIFSNGTKKKIKNNQ